MERLGTKSYLSSELKLGSEWKLEGATPLAAQAAATWHGDRSPSALRKSNAKFPVSEWRSKDRSERTSVSLKKERVFLKIV